MTSNKTFTYLKVPGVMTFLTEEEIYDWFQIEASHLSYDKPYLSRNPTEFSKVLFVLLWLRDWFPEFSIKNNLNRFYAMVFDNTFSESPLKNSSVQISYYTNTAIVYVNFTVDAGQITATCNGGGEFNETTYLEFNKNFYFDNLIKDSQKRELALFLSEILCDL